MIEIEKKFIPTEKIQEFLKTDAVFKATEKFTDIYYDTNDYHLALQDVWLRKRGNVYELKETKIRGKNDKLARTANETVGDAQIASYLGIDIITSLQDALVNAGYIPFASITTTRSTYTIEGFTIVLDDTDYGYQIGEIELLTDDIAHQGACEERILAFMQSRNIPAVYVRGKVPEYLRRTNSDLFMHLVNAGVYRNVAA